jgi:DDE superfamily endonuclease
MLSLPKVAEPLLSRFSVAFTKPTFQRAMVLLVGFVLTAGRHTVTRTLMTVCTLTSGHFGGYRRVFSRARWSLWPLARVLAALVLELVPADQPAVCAVDDTAAQHRGKRVYGKGRHRDPLRSTRTHNVWVWGHQWVVLAVNVRFPFSARPWALPVLCALYRTREVNQKEGRAHKTPITLARQLVAALLHWFPGRRFVLLGDGHYASHELARFCRGHRRRLTLVSLFHPRAHLCQPPPPRRKGQMGRRRVRGAKLPHPEDVVNGSAKRQRSTVTWYGGKRRRVEFVTGTAQWYKPADGLVPVRWVFVHDLGGTHEDRYFYSTDPALSPSRIIGLYTGRWSIEVTFQEAKQQLGLATPRNRKDTSVLRTVPCLLGLYSLVSVLFHRHNGGGGGDKTPRPRAFPWYAKGEVTFSDALAGVRRLLWEQTVFSEPDQRDALKKLPRTLREGLLDQLSRAA